MIQEYSTTRTEQYQIEILTCPGKIARQNSLVFYPG